MTPGSQSSRAALLLLIVAVVAVTGASADAANTVLKFEISNVGTHVIDDFYVRLLDNDAQNTVDNFLTYVSFQDYNGSFFHRLYVAPGLEILQGGGFYYDSSQGPIPVYKGPAIANEYGRPNVRGTIAMAKLGGDPDSATNQFFFNLSDANAATLGPFNNGGFTVFGYVIGDGMDVVDQLAGYPPNPLGVELRDLRGYWPGNPYVGAFGEVPLIAYDGYLYFETIYSVSVVGVSGDADFDGDVDSDDYDVFVATFGHTGLGLAADFDGDEDVDLVDLAILRAGLHPPRGKPASSPRGSGSRAGQHVSAGPVRHGDDREAAGQVLKAPRGM